MEDISKKMPGLTMNDESASQNETTESQVYASEPRPPIVSNNLLHGIAPITTPKFKGLSAISPEFIPKTPTRESVGVFFQSITTPLRPFSATPTLPGSLFLLHKINSLIREMPPPVFTRHPFPVPHQGNQGYESHQSPGYNTGYENTAGYLTPGYTTPRANYQVTGYSSSPVETPSLAPAILALSTSSSSYDYDAQLPRSYLAREDPTLKDILITDSKITHNIVRIYEQYDEYGQVHQICGNEYREDNYSVIDHIQGMSEEMRKGFWECNWIEIAVNFREDLEQDFDSQVKGKEAMNRKTTILDMMSRLGPDFSKYAKTVFVVILLPPTTPLSVESQDLTPEQEQSPQYKLIEELVLRLDEFRSIQKLEVILRTPVMTARSPLSLEHMNYFLPFYDLEFEDWETKWQASFMSRPETILSWPLTYLERERHKINMQRWNKKHHKGGQHFARNRMAATGTHRDMKYGHHHG